MTEQQSHSPLARYAEQVRETAPRSRRVAFIAGYYRFSAVMSGLGLVGMLVLAATNWGEFWPTMRANPFAFAFWPLNIATSWWTGELIGQRRRFGAWVAISSIGLGALSALVAHRPGASGALVLAAIGFAAIASVWRELE